MAPVVMQPTGTLDDFIHKVVTDAIMRGILNHKESVHWDIFKVRMKLAIVFFSNHRQSTSILSQLTFVSPTANMHGIVILLKLSLFFL